MNNLQLAYEKILPISREKFLDIKKLIEFIPETSSQFYETLYSLDSTQKSKTQKLIHELLHSENERNQKFKKIKNCI